MRLTVSEACWKLVNGELYDGPPALTVRAFIDTGASSTLVDHKTLKRLGVSPIGSNVSITAYDRHPVLEYDVCLILFKSINELQVIPSVRVVGADLDKSALHGTEIVIGRDLLKGWKFTYDGPKGEFTLEW